MKVREGTRQTSRRNFGICLPPTNSALLVVKPISEYNILICVFLKASDCFGAMLRRRIGGGRS